MSHLTVQDVTAEEAVPPLDVKPDGHAVAAALVLTVTPKYPGLGSQLVAAALGTRVTSQTTALLRPAAVAAVPIVPAGQMRLSLLPTQVVPGEPSAVVAVAKKLPGAAWQVTGMVVGCIPAPHCTGAAALVGQTYPLSKV
jgi:hypothetical protein